MPAILVIFTGICCGEAAGVVQEAGSISCIYLIKHNY